MPEYNKLRDLEADLNAGKPAEDIIARVRGTNNDKTRVWIADALKEGESKELKEAYDAATNFNVVYSRIQAKATRMYISSKLPNNPFSKKKTEKEIKEEEEKLQLELKEYENAFNGAVALVKEKFEAINTPQHKDFLLKISYLCQGIYLRAIDNDQDPSQDATDIKKALRKLLKKDREGGL